jgi:hypothetical protein
MNQQNQLEGMNYHEVHDLKFRNDEETGGKTQRRLGYAVRV